MYLGARVSIRGATGLMPTLSNNANETETYQVVTGLPGGSSNIYVDGNEQFAYTPSTGLL